MDIDPLYPKRHMSPRRSARVPDPGTSNIVSQYPQHSEAPLLGPGMPLPLAPRDRAQGRSTALEPLYPRVILPLTILFGCLMVALRTLRSNELLPEPSWTIPSPIPRTPRAHPPFGALESLSQEPPFVPRHSLPVPNRTAGDVSPT